MAEALIERACAQLRSAEIPFKILRHSAVNTVNDHVHATAEFEPNMAKNVLIRVKNDLVLLVARHNSDTNFKAIGAHLV